jgi:hypothetical protein
MSCTDFQRRCTNEPASGDAALRQHLADCPDCARFAKQLEGSEAALRGAIGIPVPGRPAKPSWKRIEGELDRPADADFDRRLGQAMRVEVPPGLGGRILSRHAVQRRRARRWYLSLAVVASIALAVVTVTHTPRQPGDGLPGELVAHIQHEGEALESNAEVSPAKLEATLAVLGVALDDSLGRVTYAVVCEFRRALGAHLVVTGRRGPVTIFILPAERVAASRRFDHARYAGIIIRHARGSVGIVGRHDEALEPVAKRLEQALRWRG